MQQYCNGVFAGGGVRGIGHVGAAYTLEQAGWRFGRLAGSSAGALVAALLASGYTARELRDIMQDLDYRQFRQAGLLSSLGSVGEAASLWLRLGVYRSDALMQWLDSLLAHKGVHTFGQLPPGRLTITASDVSSRRLLLLPRDLPLFGLAPDSFPIAAAVRMSCSIPLFYQPVRLRSADGLIHLIVDGGLLSNYPLWLFDKDKKQDELPAIGFKFVGDEKLPVPTPCGCPSFVQYLQMVGATTLDAADKQHIAEDGGDWARTIAITTAVMQDGKRLVIRATDFDLTQEQSRLLFQNGAEAAERFLKKQSLSGWMQQYSSYTASSAATLPSSRSCSSVSPSTWRSWS